MVVYNFKKIQTVPSANDFIDIVLTRTQRKTPTVIHPTYAISRIRAFYMRKVKFTQQTFQEKLSQIIDDFPRLDDIHPFYADLINILYDRDHYKLALGQVNTARALIDTIAKDYIRMLKYGDSLYRCKQLKRAALGRMCTLMKKQKTSLEYLEQVRQHLSRLPSIDPTSRTLLITGYPNVGKSSFMNKITNADVDVQPYAFTTKSLYIGHMDYQYLRWQVIDTPGILDHSLEERNTIEMQAITALAHLQATILFFVDISEQCGFSIEQQLSLFDNIQPLFSKKPVMMILNKIDQVKFEELDHSIQQSIKSRIQLNKVNNTSSVELMEMSNHNETGIDLVKRKGCDLLLKQRVDQKMNGKKINDVMNRLTVTLPKPRDTAIRGPVIPQSVIDKINNSMDSNTVKKLQKQKMIENGGAGVYSMDYTEHYNNILKDNEWRTDAIPEIMDGKNIMDFIDPDILRRLEELEQEEENNSFQSNEMETIDSDLDEDEKRKIQLIRNKKKILIKKHRLEKNHNRPILPRKHKRRNFNELKEHLENVNIDTSNLNNAKKTLKKTIKRKEHALKMLALDTNTEYNENNEGKRGTKRSFMDHDGDHIMSDNNTNDNQSMEFTEDHLSNKNQLKLKLKRRCLDIASSKKDIKGFKNEKEYVAAQSLQKKSERSRNKMGRVGEADRTNSVKLIKWQVSGKRGMGNTNSR